MLRMKKLMGLLLVAGVGTLIITFAVQAAGRGNGPIVYVIGQGLYYDSIVKADLPPFGPFQQLRMDGPGPDGLQTEFGPGDPGYLGGRWWVDANGNGEMDDEDAYFMCPLLGPGREEP